MAQGKVTCPSGAWTALVANSDGATPLADRQWIIIQAKGRAALALAYSNRNADGTFTAPTIDVRRVLIWPARSIIQLPVSDTVQVYGRPVRKAGDTTSNSIEVPITEFK